MQSLVQVQDAAKEFVASRVDYYTDFVDCVEYDEQKRDRRSSMPTLGATSSKSADALRFSLPVKIKPRPNPKLTSQFNETRTAFLEELYDTKGGVKHHSCYGPT